MNQVGVRTGYDVVQLALARSVLSIPLVASGGAGTAEHFCEVFELLVLPYYFSGVTTGCAPGNSLRD
jgi:hypothetical protein